MADNVKLLLVDDNPMILGMLQQALSSLASITHRKRFGGRAAQGRR